MGAESECLRARVGDFENEGLRRLVRGRTPGMTLVIIIVLVVLLFGGFGFSRRR